MDATAGVADTASKAASLLFLRVMFPDELRGSTAPLVAIGAMSLVGRAALATHQQRQQTLQQLKRRTSKLPRRVRQAAGDVVQGTIMIMLHALQSCSGMCNASQLFPDRPVLQGTCYVCQRLSSKLGLVSKACHCNQCSLLAVLDQMDADAAQS